MTSSMIDRLNERRAAGLEGQEADAGFTLIELMVVLLILAILLAIAIPTFLGVTGSANDRAAQANLNTAITDGKSVYENNQQSYPSVANAMAQSVAANEPSLSILTTVTVAPQGGLIVYVSPDGNGAIYMSLAKKTNNCWFIADNTTTVAPVGLAAASTILPWNASASIGGAAAGIPSSAGEVYGAYSVTVSGSANLACSPAELGVLSQTGTQPLAESSTAFPSQA